MMKSINRIISVFLFVLAFFPAIGGAADAIRILPQQFVLNGADSMQRLSIVVANGDQNGRVVSTQPEMFRSSDTSVVEIQDGHAVPVGDGRATITVTSASGMLSRAEVIVSHTGRPTKFSFRNDVQSVLARQGCNMGACHGALSGKGGFRLSLRGYDSEADFAAITRQARGRRIEIADPGRSLVLAKPTGALPHKGGIKLDTDSRDYRVIADWIRHGAAAPQASDARLEKITLLPANATLARGDTSQVLVNAHYDDGRVVDVTHWAKFSATDAAVAIVDDQGTVSVTGSGEAAVLVWFGSKVALARMTVPFPYQVAAEIFQQAPRRNFIDQLNLQQLQKLGLRPASRCDKDAFLRRATLDTVGRLPTIEERDAFLADRRPGHRDRVIERLIGSDAFVDYWTYRWSDMLLINGTRLRPDAVKAYYGWVRESVKANKPWDQFVREIVTATGISTENGATNFFALHQTPEDMTENACQAFLGLSIGCAKCHNHPLEKWTNDQYYSMANLFSRVRAKGWGGESRNGDGVRTVYVAASGELLQPGTGKPQPPAPLDREPLAFDDPSDRREAMADWMTDPQNPYFARSITNRVWANFFSRGLVEQVDDLRLSNPATNEPLLDAAAEHLIDAEFDLQTLVRTILQSETYQRSSRPHSDNAGDTKYLSRYFPRRLIAEVLLDSIDQVLATHTKFDEVSFPGADKQKTEFYPEGTRAIQLYDSAVSSYFLKTFGRNPREITCECERSSEPSMVQVLHLSNGETLNPKLKSESNSINLMIKAGKDNATIITSLFQAALCRDPEPMELTSILAIIDEYGDDRTTALQDAAWSVLASTEFTFSH